MILENDDFQKKTMNEKSDSEFYVKYHGQVYEISKFLKNHPGGSKILRAYKKSNLDDVLAKNKHSEAAIHILKESFTYSRQNYESIERLVDWNAPLLWQVSCLGENYWKWVNLPVNRTIRLFESDLLEFMSITPWYIIPIIWIPVSIYFLYLGFSRDISQDIIYSIPQIIIALCWGFLLWTFVEYILHRKVFHMKPSSNSSILITLHFLLHGVHHKAPFDKQRLVFPPIPAAGIIYLLYNLYNLIFPHIMTYFVTSGALIGYIFYDLTHYYLHHGSPKPDSYFYDLKRYHNYHHFSHPNNGFGISTKFWDYIFQSVIHLRILANSIEW